MTDGIPATGDDRVHEDLAEDECRRLLDSTAVGRLAYSHAALPAIVPVSYTLHDGNVIVAARRGSPVTNAVRGAVVAFGVDSWDADTRTGWGVNAIGPTRVVTTAEDVARLDALQPRARPLSPGDCYITIRVELLRGWRTAVPATPPDAASPSATP